MTAIDWDKWCSFFLQAVVDQAENNFNKAKNILALHERSRGIVADATGSQHAIRALDYFFMRPIFNSAQFRSEIEKIEYGTAGTILRKLTKKEVIHVVRKKKGQQSTLYCFHPLLEIVS